MNKYGSVPLTHRPPIDSNDWSGSVQVSCFGLGMVALDIRQESTRHTDALDAITTHLGIGSYK